MDLSVTCQMSRVRMPSSSPSWLGPVLSRLLPG